jgi:phosphomannomutase/phosphoglucomutase
MNINHPSGVKGRDERTFINSSIFRAYDIRGIYPVDLNEEVVYRTARAMAEFYPHSQKMVVACDSRLSSPALSTAAMRGFVDGGKEVLNIGIAPDPLFYFSILHYGLDGGIMVSGSHNPKEYNGLTLNARKSPNAEPEDVILEDLQRIKERISNDFPVPKTQGRVSDFDPAEDYINYVALRIHLKKPLKIVIDTGNGAVGYLPEKIFRKLGCRVKTIYGEFDGNFPNHLPDPYDEANLESVKKTILKEKADCGFAFDSDGDRVAPIDNRARTTKGDFCMWMLAKQALKKKKGPIVHDVRISKAFLDEMAKEGVKTYFSVSFHEAVRKKILETGAVFGGEITYHFFFPLDYYLCDEAILSALKLAEVVSEQDDFSSYVDAIPRYPVSPEIFIDAKDEEKFGLIDGLVKHLRENNYDFVDVDGARINFANGWALARASNTTPFIKCRFEGVTEDDLLEIKKKTLEIFKEVGIPVTKKTRQKLGLE